MHLSDFRIAELDLPKNAKEIKVKSITSDSRNSSEDCMFIAIKGNNQDGHNFIDEAISAGASNVLVDYKYKNDTKIPFLYLYHIPISNPLYLHPHQDYLGTTTPYETF